MKLRQLSAALMLIRTMPLMAAWSILSLPFYLFVQQSGTPTLAAPVTANSNFTKGKDGRRFCQFLRALAFPLLFAALSAGARADQSVTLRSGNGTVGSQDSLLRFYAYGSTGDFTPSAQQFAAAQTGTFAYIDTAYPSYIQKLPSDSLAQWTGTTPALGDGSALYAIPFMVTDKTINSASINLGYAIDNYLNGVYINGSLLSGNSSGGGFTSEYYLSRTDIASLLIPNAVNWLYLNLSDYGVVSGLIFSANITINGSSTTQAATPTFTPGAGGYAAPQKVIISDSTTGSTLYYTTDGSTPTMHSAYYNGPVIVTASGTLNAIAVAPGLTNSAQASADYSVPGSTCTVIDNSGGFTGSGLTLNGAAITGHALQLTDGGLNEARSAFSSTEVPVESFSTDFTFQLKDAVAEGFTFTIQGSTPQAVGAAGGGLGYQGITSSAAVKFDLFDTAGEGYDSTGLYVNGAAPTIPTIDMGQAQIYLHNGDVFAVHIDYINGVATGTITDTATGASANLVLQGYVAKLGEQAFVGFTASTGAQYSATQNILSWKYRGGAGCNP